MDNVVNQENSEKDADAYNHFVGSEVCLPNEQGKKMMARFTKLVKENKGNTIGI